MEKEEVLVQVHDEEQEEDEDEEEELLVTWGSLKMITNRQVPDFFLPLCSRCRVLRLGGLNILL